MYKLLNVPDRHLLRIGKSVLSIRGIFGRKRKKGFFEEEGKWDLTSGHKLGMEEFYVLVENGGTSKSERAI